MGERHFALAVGKVYTNRNGSDYLCKSIREPGCYIMERTKDKWTLEAHIITRYEDGTIEWDYSSGGHWPSRFVYLRGWRQMLMARHLFEDSSIEEVKTDEGPESTNHDGIKREDTKQEIRTIAGEK